MSSNSDKKKRKIETTLVKLPQSYRNFSITINSSKYTDSNHSNIDFTFVPDENEEFFKNGALNLSGGKYWEVSLLRLMLPNNVITFPSLSAKGNLNSAYIVLKFEIDYLNEKKEKKVKTVQVPFFLEHKKYTVDELISDVIGGIRSIFAYLCKPQKCGLIFASDIFLSTCFHLYTDPRSKYVIIKSLPSDKVNPFFQCFNQTFRKDDFLPDGSENPFLKEVDLFASLYLVNFLGEFDFSALSKSEKHSNIFENVKLDQLIFEYKNTAKSTELLLVSNKPYKLNDLSLLNFKTNLIHLSEQSEYSTLASVPIPTNQQTPINYEPINPIYFQLKNRDIREIKFLLTDGVHEKLNLTNGSVHFTLNFRTRECDNV